MKTLARLTLVLCTSPSFAQDRPPAELVAQARAGAAALAELGHVELAAEVEASLARALLEAEPADRATLELAALEAAARVLAETGAHEVSGLITRQFEARSLVREGNRERALEVLIDGPDLGETLVLLDQVVEHCARTNDPSAGVIQAGTESLRREWRRRSEARLAADVQRVIVATRVHGVGHHADRIQALQESASREQMLHREVAQAGHVLAELEPDAAEGWRELASRHQSHAYEQQRADLQRKKLKNLELLRLAEQAFEGKGVNASDRRRYEDALEALAPPAGPVPSAGMPIDPALVELFQIAASRYRAEGELQLAATFDKATAIRRQAVERDAAQRTVRKARGVERIESNQAWHRELEQGGEEALLRALRVSLRQASNAFERAGENEQAVGALGALRALNHSGLDDPGAPTIRELTVHLWQGALYESGKRRAMQMRELARRLEVWPNQSSRTSSVPPSSDHEELLDRLEALEVELEAIRRELEK